MPKGSRLARIDFKSFGRGARREHGRFFTLTAVFRASGGTRAACVVSKKTAARAVDRNRIKRRAREALRAELREITAPLSLVLYTKKEALDAPFSELAADIRQLIARALQ